MWLVFTIATTLIWGLAELFYKRGAVAGEKYAHLKICVCVGFVMGIHALTVLIIQGINYNPVNLIRYLPVTCSYVLSMALSFFGMRFIEESISDPIENTSGAICCLLCAIFLKEHITTPTACAVILIVIGILGLGYLEKNGSTDRRKLIGNRMAVIAFAMPFCYAILDAVGSFMDIYYLDMQTSPLVDVTEDSIELVANTTYEITFFIAALVLLIFMKSRGVKFGRLTEHNDKIIAAVCETAGQLTYVYAMSGNGAIAAPIISSVCVVSLLLSRIVLKEKLTRTQYIFLGLVICGILILSIIEG